MAKVRPELFTVLNDAPTATVLTKLYKATLQQTGSLLLHFLPKAGGWLTGRGMSWKGENLSFYDDKYIPVHPDQGAFMYLQARALGARHIVEFGTSYGVSTLYLALAARENGGKVISAEYLPHKVKAARIHLEEAGLGDYADVWEGDARETLRNLEYGVDFLLLDGFPDMVGEIFRLVEPKLKKGAVIVVDDVDGFPSAMRDYLDYVRNPANGYLSARIMPAKGMEFTIKVR